MSRSLLTLLPCGVLWLAPGCADKIDQRPDAGAPDAGQAGKVQTSRGSDATYTSVIDATSTTDWVHADFETGGEVPATGAWDLRFQRFHISANGGVSGAGGVEVAALTGQTFAAVTAAPGSGFFTDVADGNADGLPDYVLDQGEAWYAYDVGTHKLTPRPIVWVVKTAGGSMIKLEILKYYDDVGTPALFTVHWAPL